MMYRLTFDGRRKTIQHIIFVRRSLLLILVSGVLGEANTLTPFEEKKKKKKWRRLEYLYVHQKKSTFSSIYDICSVISSICIITVHFDKTTDYCCAR